MQAPVSANLCMQLPQTGPCRSAICSWFYAAATASCMPLPCVEGSAALSNAPAPVCVEPQTNPYVIPDSYSGCWATGLHHLSLNYALVPQKGGVASGWKLGSGARAHVAGCEACSLGCKAPRLGAACPRSSALSTGKCSDSRMGESNWPGASGSGCRSSAGRSGRLRRCAGDGRMVSRESVQYFPHHRPSAFASSQVSSHSTGQIDLQRQAHQTGLFAWWLIQTKCQHHVSWFAASLTAKAPRHHGQSLIGTTSTRARQGVRQEQQEVHGTRGQRKLTAHPS